MKKRIEWVDIGKYICIMFVMLSHLESHTQIMDNFFMPFYLNCFFFLSGYVYKSEASFKEHLVKKVKGLLVPWFVFSNFNILLSAIISFKENRNLLNEFLFNFLQIRGCYDGLWFIAALFAAFIPFYFVIKKCKPLTAIILSLCLSALSFAYSVIVKPEMFPWHSTALPWHLEYIFKAMLWMVLGYYFKMYGERIFDKYNKPLPAVIITAAYVALAYAPLKLPFGVSVVISYFQVSLGIMMVVSISKLVKTNKYFSFVGANTLTYFALHGKLYAIIQNGLKMAVGSIYTACLGNVLASSALSIAITIAMSFILIIPAMIINRYFPFVLGRKYIKPAKKETAEVKI